MPRQRKCKHCGNPYMPTMPMQNVCSLSCAIAYGKVLGAKKEAREHKEAKKKAKTRAQWMKEAQSAFNRYIRARDNGKPCISCGRVHFGQIHAGHYRTTKAAPELRFDERNCHSQCAPCNTHLSGNLVLYRKALIEKIGVEMVEWLEGPHEPKKYTIDDLRTLKDKYTRLSKDKDRT